MLASGSQYIQRPASRILLTSRRGSLVASKRPRRFSLTIRDSNQTGEAAFAQTANVVQTSESAKSTILLAVSSFNSKQIAMAVLEAQKRGLDVHVVVDKLNATARYTAATFLANEGVPVRVDYRYAIMHDKFIVVDGETVETGSLNYTHSASKRNAENAWCSTMRRLRNDTPMGGIGYGNESEAIAARH